MSGERKNSKPHVKFLIGMESVDEDSVSTFVTEPTGNESGSKSATVPESPPASGSNTDNPPTATGTRMK